MIGKKRSVRESEMQWDAMDIPRFPALLTVRQPAAPQTAQGFCFRVAWHVRIANRLTLQRCVAPGKSQAKAEI
ncbi:MAG: hypothetical protein JSS41_02170 [Proteobacteria bacterium]|nr:hypothetical protein [Pseudomonadota bacterium]